jgi:hypothetical protein
MLNLERGSGLLGLFTIASYGSLMLYKANTGQIILESISLTSWFMWCCLDILLWAIAKRRGEVPFLIIGWTAATSVTTLGFWISGATWSIDVVTLVSVACVVATALAFWFAKEPIASYAGGLALYVSGIPQLVSYLEKPDPNSWWLWFFAAIATALSLYSKNGFDIVPFKKLKNEKLFMERLTLFSQITFFIVVLR